MTAIPDAPVALSTAQPSAERARILALMNNPPVSRPTLVLAAVAFAGWLTILAAAVAGALPAPLAVALLTLAGYLTFTPMHDASHGSVGRSRWLNELTGRLAGVPLMAPFRAFRFAHLEHHRNTNDPARDPDMWSGGRFRLTLPLRWMTQDLHYYAFYFRHLASRPRDERVETVVTLLALWGAAALAAASGHGREVLLFVVLPSRLAIGLLACSFDWLPHAPHQVLGAEDRFRATLNVRWSAARPGRFLTPLLVSQNYHLVHHLFPGVPFYRYGAVWHARERELVAKGAGHRTLRRASPASSVV
ncbi:MAG: fatty acid desaturase [Deltaproteobacteria bacterium]|nr:fatty acid desaturase [Deltaproteobacteria bacterium]